MNQPLRNNNLENEFLERVMDAQGIIHKVCSIYCNDEEEKKDLFQEILINLWKSYGSFQGKSKFTTWMYRVSLNVALQHLQNSNITRNHITHPDKFDEMNNPGKEGLPEKEIQEMYAAINQLNEVEKAIVMLYLDEKGNEEIAEIIGISQNYVRVKMTRIRKKLKKIVEGQDYGT